MFEDIENLPDSLASAAIDYFENLKRDFLISAPEFIEVHHNLIQTNCEFGRNYSSKLKADGKINKNWEKRKQIDYSYYNFEENWKNKNTSVPANHNMDDIREITTNVNDALYKDNSHKFTNAEVSYCKKGNTDKSINCDILVTEGQKKSAKGITEKEKEHGENFTYLNTTLGQKTQESDLKKEFIMTSDNIFNSISMEISSEASELDFSEQ